MSEIIKHRSDLHVVIEIHNELDCLEFCFFKKTGGILVEFPYEGSLFALSEGDARALFNFLKEVIDERS